MSLDKAIEHGKEKRKQYRGCKAIDKTCRNHGDCPFCQQNRLKNERVEKEVFKSAIDDDYPCTDKECYDRGNFHTTCDECPSYINKDLKEKEIE